MFLQISGEQREDEQEVLSNQQCRTSLQGIDPQSEGMARGDVSDSTVQRIKVEQGSSGDVAARGIKVNDRELGVGEGDEDRVKGIGNEAGCPFGGDAARSAMRGH